GEAAHDREPESHAPGAVALAGADLIELLEDPLALRLGDARARIPQLDRDAFAAAPDADDYPATRGVADRVGGEVVEDAFQQQGVAVDPGARRHDGQAQS